jgi:hypothetical protein
MNRFRLAFIVLPVLSLFAGCEKEKEDYILRFYGDAYEDVGYSVAAVSDGYIIAGQLHDIVRNGGLIDNDLSNRNLGIIKTDWNGMVKWKKSAGGKYSDRGNRFTVLDDGSIICTGTFTDTTSAATGKDVYIVKFSPSGDIIWEKHYGGVNNQEGTDILTVTGGFVITGTTDSEIPPAPPFAGNILGKTNPLLLRISAAGDSLDWADNFGFPNNDTPVALKLDNSPGNAGGYIILASSEQNVSGSLKINPMMIQVNSSFNAVTHGIFSSSSNEIPSDFELTDNGYMVCGTAGTSTEPQMAFIRYISHSIAAPQAAAVPFKVNESNLSLKALSRYPGGGYIAAGYSGNEASGNMIVFRTDDDGNLLGNTVFTSGGSGSQVLYDVTAGDDGWVIATGKNSLDSNSLISFLKFRY